MASIITANNFNIYYNLCDVKHFKKYFGSKVSHNLNQEEIDYLKRFNNKKRRRQSQIAISQLKILGHKFFEQKIENICVLHDANNRPWIKMEHDKNIRIFPVSIAHSNNLVFCALIDKSIPTLYSIGVDIEKVCNERNLIIAKYFNYNELKYINQALGLEKCTLFTRFWTRKEALVKTNLVDLKDALNLDLTKNDNIFINKPYGFYKCSFTSIELGKIDFVASIAITTELPQE